MSRFKRSALLAGCMPYVFVDVVGGWAPDGADEGAGVEEGDKAGMENPTTCDIGSAFLAGVPPGAPEPGWDERSREAHDFFTWGTTGVGVAGGAISGATTVEGVTVDAEAAGKEPKAGAVVVAGAAAPVTVESTLPLLSANCLAEADVGTLTVTATVGGSKAIGAAATDITSPSLTCETGVAGEAGEPGAFGVLVVSVTEDEETVIVVTGGN